MDWLRSCYTGTLKPFAGSGLLVPVTWFFCAPGAKLFTPLSAFGSSVWDPTKRMDPPAGEQASYPRVWRDGSAPGFLPGDHYCGSEADFRGEGREADPPVTLSAGVRACCSPLPIPFPPCSASLPWRLRLHSEEVTGGGGSCPNMTTSDVDFAWDPVSNRWKGDVVGSIDSAVVCHVEMDQAGFPYLSGCTPGFNSVVLSCSPFSLVVQVSGTACCQGLFGYWMIVIDEWP